MNWDLRKNKTGISCDVSMTILVFCIQEIVHFSPNDDCRARGRGYSHIWAI